MNIYLLLSYFYIHSTIPIISEEYAILREEENDIIDNIAIKASDYTLYFESYQFDIFNENDWDKYKISSQTIDNLKEDSQLFMNDNSAQDNNIEESLLNNHRLLLNENENDNYYDELYYNYYINNNGNKEILNEIKACSNEIQSLNNKRLCIDWHNENGLKLGLT
eukprot:125741_1